MSESLKSASVRVASCSTGVLPQSTTAVVSVTLGPTASAISSTVSDGSVMPTTRTYMGSDIGPRRTHVNLISSVSVSCGWMMPVSGSTV